MSGADSLTVECSVHFAEGLQLPPDVSEATVSSLFQFALETEGQSGEWYVSVVFVTVEKISRLHGLFLGDASPTDIITFPYDEEHIRGGDIAVCAPLAAEQGPEHGKTEAEELLFLVLHGLLHLIGYDDADEEARAAMLTHQDELLNAWAAVSR